MKHSRVPEPNVNAVPCIFLHCRFVQAAAVSPLMDHVLLGGGQDASQVI